MPDEAYSSAIFDEDEGGRAASDLTALVELDPGCARHDTPAGVPGGGSITSGCASCDTPDDGLSGESMVTDSVVTTGVGPGEFLFSTRYVLNACIARVVPKPGVVGPAVVPGGIPEVITPDALWSAPRISGFST